MTTSTTLAIMSQSNIRLDQNFVANILQTKESFEDDANLVKSILYYFSLAYQYNMFSFGSVTVNEIAKGIKVSPANLRRKHPKPKQLRGLSDEEIKEKYALQAENPEQRVYDSYLENALYLLRTETMYYNKTGNTFTQVKGKSVKASIGQVNFLKSFDVSISDPSKKNSKITYLYELDDSYLSNLTTLYLNTNLQALIELRKNSLDDLYLYVKNLRENLWASNQQLKGTPAFTLLDKYINYNHKLARRRKLYVNNAFAILKEYDELGIENFYWTKEHATSKFDYQLIIEYYPKYNSDITAKLDRNLQRNQIFAQNIGYELIEHYKHAFPAYYQSTTDLPGDILKWLNKPKVDPKKSEHINALKLIWSNAYFKTYRTVTTDKFSTHILSFANNLYKIKSFINIIDIISTNDASSLEFE